MKIIATTGDMNGIGFEVLVKSLHLLSGSGFNHEVAIAGSIDAISRYIMQASLQARVQSNFLFIGSSSFSIIDLPCTTEINFGSVSRDSGNHAAESVKEALRRVVSGEYSAMVTMPIAKEAVYLAGWQFPGHTEMIADFCGGQDPLMILFAENLRVALATVHVPIHDVPRLLTRDLIKNVTTKLYGSLTGDFGIGRPRVAVLGLNPHSGESGNIGSEEKDVIIPAIEELSSSDIDVSGPYASDGFFAFGEYRNFHGIVAMYHDQGLIPLKLIAGGNGVNFTAGLPIVRTSPDHGTAFSIAGKNMADPRSTIYAFRSAIEIVNNRMKLTSTR